MTEGAPRQSWHADRYATNARFVAELGAPVIELLAPRPGERILDLGCGDGALTERLAAFGCAVIGIDAAADMVAAARRRGLEAYVADGENLRCAAQFDAVFSNAALHWMRDADAVLRGVRRALKPGGRFVGEFGGHGNVAAITVALVAVLRRRGVDGRAAIPWYFPSAEAYAARLEAHGFAVDQIDLIPRPTPLPTNMAGWLETFAESFFGRLPDDQRGAARDEALHLLMPCLCDERGRWTADYVDVARQQKAKALELRAATGLARFWAARGQRQKARDLIAPVYGWFTEGFDTADLKEAGALLDQLA